MDPQPDASSPPALWSPPTPTLVVAGGSIFVTGFFLLAVAGKAFGPGVYALVLGGALLLLLPLLLVTVMVAGLEAMVGRAWASGFRTLLPPERGLRGLSTRALRYAGWLWLANGAAFWFAMASAAL